MIQSKESGFTLVEIVVTLIILGILAAFALPRFANTSTDARKAAASTLLGAMKSASSLAHSIAVIQSQTGLAGSISMENVTVSLAYGYPAVAVGGLTMPCRHSITSLMRAVFFRKPVRLRQRHAVLRMLSLPLQMHYQHTP